MPSVGTGQFDRLRLKEDKNKPSPAAFRSSRLVYLPLLDANWFWDYISCIDTLLNRVLDAMDDAHLVGLKSSNLDGRPRDDGGGPPGTQNFLLEHPEIARSSRGLAESASFAGRARVAANRGAYALSI
jgi:hypothetical protein